MHVQSCNTVEESDAYQNIHAHVIIMYNVILLCVCVCAHVRVKFNAEKVTLIL